MFSADDRRWMTLALRLAHQAAQDGEVPVGAVVVRDGEALGSGRNRCENGDRCAHAELEALRAAAANGGRTDGCTLYVTLEPCAMCAGAILNCRIGRVVYGAKAPQTGCCGSVCNLFAMPFARHTVLQGGLMEAEASALLTDFFATQARGSDI